MKNPPTSLSGQFSPVTALLSGQFIPVTAAKGIMKQYHSPV